MPSASSICSTSFPIFALSRSSTRPTATSCSDRARLALHTVEHIPCERNTCTRPPGRRHFNRLPASEESQRTQRVAHALGVGEGCAVTASYPEVRSDHHHANSFRTAPSLCADMIFGKDNPAQRPTQAASSIKEPTHHRSRAPRLAHANEDGSLRVEGVCPCSQPSRSPHIALTVGIFVSRALGFLDERAIKALLRLKLEGAQPG